jgi:hypothetical protein
VSNPADTRAHCRRLANSTSNRWLICGCVYRRAIVPIGIMFSLSLICGNLAYLYLSVSFIQMLKVRTNRGLVSQFQARLTSYTGYQRCRDSPGHLGFRYCPYQHEDPRQCVPHCCWCCDRLFRRNQVRHVRFPEYVISSESQILSLTIPQSRSVVSSSRPSVSLWSSVSSAPPSSRWTLSSLCTTTPPLAP